MIFLVQFGINKHLLISQRPQIARALRARAILLDFEKIYSCLFIPNCTRNHVITFTNRTLAWGETKHSELLRFFVWWPLCNNGRPMPTFSELNEAYISD